MGKASTKLGTGLYASCKGWGRFGLFVLSVLVVVPPFTLARALRVPKTEKIPQLFHGWLCRVFGMRVRVHGKAASNKKGPLLFVSNHSSYLDIFVLGSVIEGCFVAKAEVEGWPILGTLSKLQNTIFVERRAARAALHRQILRDNLEAGNSLILFPEGTSSDGMRTLPFKSTLFSIVEEPLASGALPRVQPVSALCTGIAGMPMERPWRPYYAWFGDMTLVKHVWDVLKIADFTVDVIFHTPVTMEEFNSRKDLTAHCQEAIADGVNQCVTQRFKGRAAHV